MTVRFGDLPVGSQFYLLGERLNFQRGFMPSTLYVKESNHSPTAAQPWNNAREVNGAGWPASLLPDTQVQPKRSNHGKANEPGSTS